MKRNWDTIRKILIRLEEKEPGEHSLRLSSWPKDVQPEISYHVELLEEAGLIHGHMSKTMGLGPYDFSATRLTWEGHELLDAIKNDTIWKKTKKLFSSKGISMTFDLVKSVAIKLATDFLKDNMGG